MCGGGTKIPLVQKTITEALKGADILNSIPPDEVIAIGAAKQVSVDINNESKNYIKRLLQIIGVTASFPVVCLHC